ncbi:Uncharacterised protein [Bordetella pertussis]|nr:Uncharacterised protein [Bordetella pertussis]
MLAGHGGVERFAQDLACPQIGRIDGGLDQSDVQFIAQDGEGLFA